MPAERLIDEIAKLVDPTAHEMYDAAYVAKDWAGQMVWIKRLEASREKASNILFRLNPPPASSQVSRPHLSPERKPQKVCLYSDGCPMDGPVCHLCAHVQP